MAPVDDRPELTAASTAEHQRAPVVRPGRRREPSILHVDLDAFYAAVEQRDKPSLRGRPVVVGGTGLRGVVATASYEARRSGVHSAMSVAQARLRCPHAAFLAPRFAAYRAASEVVMAALAERSPLVEPLSLDEAFVDLAAGPAAAYGLDSTAVRDLAADLKRTVTERTGLVASVGAASSKLVAKIASDLGKPDGLVVVEPGTELDVLAPMSVRALWGVGPATADRLAALGVRTVGDLGRVTADELVTALGDAQGRLLHRLARAEDDRPVVVESQTKSVSVEDTFDTDVADPRLLRALADRMAHQVCQRMAAAGLSGRTVTLKARLPDFTTVSRSQTLPAPTDDSRTVARVARRLLEDVDVRAGLRLLGVGMSGLADWVQDDLFVRAEGDGPPPRPDAPAREDEQAALAAAHVARRWRPGQDVVHATYGAGWVWGSGRGRVTVRFETRDTGPGPVRTFAEDDPALSAASQPTGGD